MANPATVALAAKGRTALPITPAVIPIAVTLNATTYATATGGLPFDIAPALLAAGPAGSQQINPADVIDFIGYFRGSTVDTGAICDRFVVGTATYTAQKDAGAAEPGVGTLATCPCTIHIYGTGGADDAPFGEIEDADLTGSLVGYLLIARGGHS